MIYRQSQYLFKITACFLTLIFDEV